MPQKRANALAIHSIDHFGLQVPDFEEAHAFYDAFGLDVRSSDDGLGLHTYGNPQCWGRITKGPVKQLRYLSFGIYPEDEAAIAAHLESHGATRIDPVIGAPKDGLWIEGFDGLPINIRVADKCSPADKTRFETISSAAGTSGAVFNSSAPKTLPRHLSHFAIYTTDVIAATHWYETMLGLRLSDGSGPVVAFLHGAHGSDHHLLALVGSTHRGMHHSSWDVASFQEVGLGSAQMFRAGFKQGWGVGRHVLGGNYFYYARDPWGSYAEFSADIDYIPADCEWPAAQHDPSDSFYLWGPDVPPELVANLEPGAPA
ncbi:MAG: VOC family protein [Blastomonas sp.]|jgi:catechol 2,3-dioxygenase-like lactoylglutathione lyase family enzyme|uniref:VOC family protein n=1 Tax=Blastomonas TaxID=150203 RepID=UPI0006B98D76|nr:MULTISPECIES: VOC family protein [unclassified Blastomonas]AOG00562.1 glyoxalase/Bleomycin resistance /Dioxygenase superfamily protein [Blastomonas sp. RAC04]KPF74056.1 metapyrocatechase [Blastomonas sp. AAP25]MCO5791964.1 VOC family protein [Blastomonas sp.]